MLFQGGFTFINFLVDVFFIFMFVVWFWLLIMVMGDLFRRPEVSGLGKALRMILLIVLPYVGVLIYLISQSRGMAERERERQARHDLRQSLGFSVADELEWLGRLQIHGAIASDESTRGDRMANN
jgi:hypothetical protein